MKRTTERQVKESIDGDSTQYSTGSTTDIMNYLEGALKTNIWGFGVYQQDHRCRQPENYKSNTFDLWGGEPQAFTNITQQVSDVNLDTIKEMKYATFTQKLQDFFDTYNNFMNDRKNKQKTPNEYDDAEIKVLESISGILGNLISELVKFDAHMKTYFTDESTKHTGISADLIKDFMYVWESQETFVNSVLINMPKITAMTSKYNKLLVIAMAYRKELDKEVTLNIESYEIIHSISNILLNSSLNKTRLEIVINFNVMLANNLKELFSKQDIDYRELIENLSSNDIYMTHTMFNLTAPDLFFNGETPADMDLDNKLIDATLQRIKIIRNYISYEFDVIEIDKSPLGIFENVFNPLVNPTIKGTLITGRYVEEAQKARTLALFKVYLTDDLPIQAKIIADKVGGEFMPGICANSSSIKDSAFPIILSLSCEFYYYMFLIAAPVNAATEILDKLCESLLPKDYFYWHFVMKLVVIYAIRVGITGEFEPTKGILILNCIPRFTNNIQAWYTKHHVKPPIAVMNSCYYKDYEANNKCIRFDAKTISLTMSESLENTSTINQEALKDLKKLNYEIKKPIQSFHDLNKIAPTVLSNINPNTTKESVITAPARLFNVGELVQIVSKCLFLNKNINMFKFNKEAHVFQPMSLFFERAAVPPQPALKGIIKELRLNLII